MKNLNAYIRGILTMMVLAGFLGLAACAKKSNSGANRVQNRGNGTNFTNANGTLNGTGAGQIPTSCGGTSQSSAGRLIDDGSLYGAFRSNYAEFLGTELGELDGSASSTSTGVDIELRIKLNGQSVLAEQSQIRITVYDSEVDNLGAIVVSYDRATRAEVNASGEVVLTFEDNYGQLFVQARNMGSQVQGRVFYKNKGMSQEKSLGGFTLSTCGVFY